MKPEKTQTRAGDMARVDSLLCELDDFLDEPRADEILRGEWLHDATLPIPSAELLELFAIELLFGFGKYERFYIADRDGIQKAISLFIAEMKHLPLAPRRDLVTFAIARMNILSLTGITRKSLHWWPSILGLQADVGFEGTSMFAGMRRVTRHMIEALTMRAIFQGDAPCLEGLVEVVRKGGVNAAFKPTSGQEIALQILRWTPYLVEKLARAPSKTETQTFLLSLYPGLSDSPATWTEVRKSFRFEVAESRSRRIDKFLIEKLAREASTLETLARQGKGKDPTRKKVPSWRLPPKNLPAEDVQK